ncbi:hypothetical protein KAR91_21560 [Candidatus Pacearchaeota archaeon]|nr:hypothetical protein [Candidatus Pacearchaeota archaeon]
MTEKEIIKTLKDNWIKPDGKWRTYEKAKKIICEGDLLPSEYDERLRIITDYLKI